MSNSRAEVKLSLSPEKQLKRAIISFSLRDKCQDPDWCRGCCDDVSIAFLEHARSFGLDGYLLAVANPYREPDEGWKFYGGHWKECGTAISHFVAFFPKISTITDFTARQFWKDAKVPMILKPEQLYNLWDQLPYGWQDAMKHEPHYTDT